MDGDDIPMTNLIECTSKSLTLKSDESVSSNKIKKSLKNIHKSASLTNIDLNGFLCDNEKEISIKPNVFEYTNLSDSDSAYSPQTTLITAARSVRTCTLKRKGSKVLDLLGISKTKSNDAPLLNDDINQHHMVAMTDSDDSSLCLDEPIDKMMTFKNKTSNKTADECFKSASYDFHHVGAMDKLSSTEMNNANDPAIRTLSDLKRDMKLKQKLEELNEMHDMDIVKQSFENDGKNNVQEMRNFNFMYLMVKQGMYTSRNFNSVKQISKYQGLR